MSSLRDAHAEQLAALKTPSGQPLAELLEEGLSASTKPAAAVAAAIAAKDALAAQTELPFLLAVDDYNVLYSHTGYYESVHSFHRRQLAPDELRLVSRPSLAGALPAQTRVQVSARTGRAADTATAAMLRFVPACAEGTRDSTAPTPTTPHHTTPHTHVCTHARIHTTPPPRRASAGTRFPCAGAARPCAGRRRGGPHLWPDRVGPAAPSAAGGVALCGAAVRHGRNGRCVRLLFAGGAADGRCAASPFLLFCLYRQ